MENQSVIKIAFLLESTFLCGGVKVVLCQAEALLKMGHQVKVVSGDPAPDWFSGEICFVQKNPFTFGFDKEFDIIIVTTPELALFHYRHAESKKIYHLIQGYEGDFQECLSMKNRIEKAYRLPVVKLTVSERLATRLENLFPGPYFSIGQGLEHDYFYDLPTSGKWRNPDRVFLVGPLSISVKQIDIGLTAFKKVQKVRPNLNLVRISSVDTRKEEEKLTGPIGEYHTHLKPEEVGRVFRTGCGVLISPSGAGEGFGLPPLEAMACGVPTVLTNIPSYNSFAVPVDYARFVAPGDAISMAQGLMDVLHNHQERCRLISRGLEVASLYRFEKVARKMENIFRNVR